MAVLGGLAFGLSTICFELTSWNGGVLRIIVLTCFFCDSEDEGTITLLRDLRAIESPNFLAGAVLVYCGSVQFARVKRARWQYPYVFLGNSPCLGPLMCTMSCLKTQGLPRAAVLGYGWKKVVAGAWRQCAVLLKSENSRNIRAGRIFRAMMAESPKFFPFAVKMSWEANKGAEEEDVLKGRGAGVRRLSASLTLSPGM
ncbi:hypothetical protein BJ322DRAFT_147855 [Thelephora terrestris]|uniref:Uncharacterized protein n=1 Tax=Thelephora terrestris TaxID=56493 RepID=A0A9P6L5P3_9AGAM|nr:hypothetical protein BJ322DRAFT_147855 [Thelephora terrestris]